MDVRGKRPFDLIALVLLPDHLHAIWSLPLGDADYPIRWAQIKECFTRYLLRRGWSRRDDDEFTLGPPGAGRLAAAVLGAHLPRRGRLETVRGLLATGTRSSMGWSDRSATIRGRRSIDSFVRANTIRVGGGMSRSPARSGLVGIKEGGPRSARHHPTFLFLFARFGFFDPEVEAEGLDQPLEAVGGDDLGGPDPDGLAGVRPPEAEVDPDVVRSGRPGLGGRRGGRRRRDRAGVPVGPGGRRALRPRQSDHSGGRRLSSPRAPANLADSRNASAAGLLGRGDDLVVVVQDVAEDGRLGHLLVGELPGQFGVERRLEQGPGDRAGACRPGRPGGGSTGPAA